MALPFLRHESEENATQAIAFIAIVGITLGLAIFNVSGAIAGSQSDNPLELVIRFAFGLILTGAEFLAAVALVRVMLAPNLHRKVIGTVIFLGLAWVCIQNGKRSAHLIFPEFAQSATLLEEQARIATDQESERLEAKGRALEAAPALLSKVQNDLAEAQRKQRLLQAQSPEKISEMQQMLISEGYYFFTVDGRIGPETERAMRAMGEDLRNDMARLEDQEARLMTGLTTVQALKTDDASVASALTPAAQAAILNDRAVSARRAAIWIEVALWVLEAARSFGLWALVTTITAAQTDKDPTRVAAGRKAAETRKRNDRRIRKVEEQWSGYEKQWLAALKKARTTNWTAEAINDFHFNGGIDHIIALGKRAKTRPEFDAEVRLLKRMDDNLPAVRDRNDIDVIDPDPASLNGTGRPIDDGENDADNDTERPRAD